MPYKRSGFYTSWSTYTGGTQEQEANNSQLGNLNPFWVGTRLLCIETLVVCMH